MKKLIATLMISAIATSAAFAGSCCKSKATSSADKPTSMTVASAKKAAK